MAAAPDYPYGWSSQSLQRLRDYIAAAWGRGHSISAAYGKRAEEPELASWAHARKWTARARAQRATCLK